jgi:hypothetical protein
MFNLYFNLKKNQIKKNCAKISRYKSEKMKRSKTRFMKKVF